MNPNEQKLRNRALYRCSCSIGVHEQPPGSNRGPEVDRYQLHFGKEYLGTYWCASWLGFEFDHAALDVGVPMPFRISPSCGDILKRAHLTGRVIDSPSKIKPSDLVIFHAEHIGVVTGVHDGWITTIEANTSPTPGIQPNGGGVYPKRHQITSSMVFVDCCRA